MRIPMGARITDYTCKRCGNAAPGATHLWVDGGRGLRRGCCPPGVRRKHGPLPLRLLLLLLLHGLQPPLQLLLVLKQVVQPVLLLRTQCTDTGRLH